MYKLNFVRVWGVCVFSGKSNLKSSLFCGLDLLGDGGDLKYIRRMCGHVIHHFKGLWYTIV